MYEKALLLDADYKLAREHLNKSSELIMADTVDLIAEEARKRLPAHQT